MRHFLALVMMLGGFLAATTKTYAVCPVCTVAVGAGLGISRIIGIDDSVTGIWIGGLILSSGLWLADWLGKRGWRVALREVFAVGLLFVLVIPPLYWTKMIGLPGNRLWGVDKILLGTMLGAVFFLVGVWIDRWLRSTNHGKVYVYYQKVIIPVLLLSIGSFVFYFISS